MSLDEQLRAELERETVTTLPTDQSEDGLALSFCEAHPHLRYVAKWNAWMLWNGACWIDDGTLAVYDRIRVHIRNAAGTNMKDKTPAKAQTVAAVERLARADRRYAATVDCWDLDEWLLNTPAGVVDLRSGVLRPHAPQEYMTKVTAAGPAGDCPIWNNFLLAITGNDPAYVAFLQRVMGYCITGSVKEHALFFFYGTGGNGKGTFLNMLQAILKDYASVSSTDTFTESARDRHPTELAALRGARVVFAQETEEAKAWAETKIKALTGGDPITARYMRQDFFTFSPKFKLLIAGNHKPALRNVDEAIRRRLHLLPFMEKFSADKRDLDLPDKLKAESGGIMKWIVDGTSAYLREGLNPPPVVVEATAEYFLAENTFGQWIAESCETNRDFWETPTRLFMSWRRFAEDANERPGAQKQFAERLQSAGFRSGNYKARGGRHWAGLRIRENGFDSE